jgi:NADH:ubiquinone oxidoreductase subunit 6 (subunit J)
VIFFPLGTSPFLFYLLIFIHQANPGYALAFLPALLVLTATSVGYLGAELKQTIKGHLTVYFSVVIVLNIFFFIFSAYPVSSQEIRNHDRDLSILLDGIRFEPSKRLFSSPYIFFGYRQIMYYLPEYRAYQVDVR